MTTPATGKVNLISEVNLVQCMVKMDTGQENILREYHTRAKQKYEDYKSYHDNAGRMYFAIHTLLNNSLQSTKSEILEKYIRNNAEAMGKSPTIFDVNEWEHSLKLAKTCRLSTPEITSAHIEYFKKESKTLLLPTLNKAHIALQEMNEIKSNIETEFIEFQHNFSGFQQQILTVLSKFARKDWLRKAAATEELQMDLDREIEKTLALEGQIDDLTQQVKTLGLQRVQERDHFQQQITSLTNALAVNTAAAAAASAAATAAAANSSSSIPPTTTTTIPSTTHNGPDKTTSSTTPIPTTSASASAPGLGPSHGQLPFEIGLDGTFKGPPFPTNCHCKGQPTFKLVQNLTADVERLTLELDKVGLRYEET